MTTIPPDVAAMSPSVRHRHRLVLGGILLFGLAIRLAYLLPRLSDPGFELVDPDHYWMGGQILARDGWPALFRAVRYEYAGRFYHLPPLYPLFLSFFSRFAHPARAALVAQTLLNVAGLWLLYELGRRVHSVRAGLLASAVYALWLPGVIASWFYQESLYVPLVLLAFVATLWAFGSGSLVRFLLAGIAFGIATLTRTMPLYFVPPLALLHVALARPPKRAAVRESLAILLGCAIPVVPYSVAISRHLGEVTLVENHAGIELLSRDTEAQGTPAIVETAASLARSFRNRRGQLIGDLYGSVRSVLHLNGGRILQIYIVARSRAEAVLWKAAAHVFGDLGLASALLLAPFGIVLARSREASVAAAMWIVLNVALVALGGFAGPRLRAPFEPLLILFGAVVLAGAFRRVGRGSVVAAAAVSLAAAAILVPQIPRTAAAWPDYGIRWQARPKGWRSVVRGRAGFNYLVRGDVVTIEIRSREADGAAEGPGPGPGSSITVVHVRLDGRAAATETLRTRERRELRFARPGGTLTFVELDAARVDSAAPAVLLVVAQRPR